MKTIAFGRQGGIFKGMFVLAALGGLYYFRRQGGTVSDLWAKGTQGLNQARGLISRVAPSAVNTSMKSATNSASRSVASAARI